ncbi:MAG: DUF1501 domain-containing protein [Pirellula sp.]
MTQRNHGFCGRTRRTFLSNLGMGFGGIALNSILHQDAYGYSGTHGQPDGKPHFAPKAKNVIWIFLSGGVSHMETFDPKPLLNAMSGKTYDETSLPNPQKLPMYLERSRSVVGFDRELHSKIFPLQVGFQRYGEIGLDVSDWLPNLASCADELAVVRSMWTTDNDHAAEFQMHTGRHKLDSPEPVIGSWLNYGLGTLNQNLPQFVFLGEFKDPRVKENFDAHYLGPTYGGVHMHLDPANPLAFGNRAKDMSADEQRGEFEFLQRLNRLSADEYPQDAQLKARINAYELAFRMQTSVPETLDFTGETQETLSLYGIDNKTTEIHGQRCLAARRLAERGVRYTLVYLSDYGEWDSHSDLQKNHARSCERIDKPIAGLLKDMKRRGMFSDTVVVFTTEFGRTPGVEFGMFNKAATGRDHHPHGFSIWLAGAGIRPGIHGATDELGFHAIENPHYVTDLHATIYQLLGLDPRRLEIPGRKRLEIDYGQAIREVIA